ncbi:hypothetical protein [Metabacillus sp. RGM 3146]|uniref:hypothetical protein n=1 Tax=Metabacillus sp. RGM 3146 TaxID=3401092 RepID=UPI003B9CE0F9
MNKYTVNYYLGGELQVTRVIESDQTKADVLELAKAESHVTFEDEKGVLHFFSMDDVKLVTIHDARKSVGIGPRPAGF